VTGAIGIAGGILLGRNALQRDRKILGISVPSKVDFSGVREGLGEAGKQFGEAGKQFGKLAAEVRSVAGEVRGVREKAEQIGKVLG
jgi:phage-related minor tail protein